MTADLHEGLPIVQLPDRAAWRGWLHDHHTRPDGVWLKLARKPAEPAAVRPTPSHAEALEVALCFGWIDGTRKPWTDGFFLQRFTPRRARSRWSRVNRDKAVELIERGEMAAAGLAEVERAKRDGRWDAAYEPQSAATVPDDFAAALAAHPAAAEFFATLTGANRYAFLYRIADAKRPETRARRIEQFIEMLDERRMFH